MRNFTLPRTISQYFLLKGQIWAAHYRNIGRILTYSANFSRETPAFTKEQAAAPVADPSRGTVSKEDLQWPVHGKPRVVV